MLARQESGTLRDALNKSMEEYAKNLPLSIRFLGQSDKEKTRIATYARHLTSVKEIDLASEVLGHIKDEKNRPCEMSKNLCDVLRESLRCYFNITHRDIIRAEPDLYKSGVAASGYANTGSLAQQNYIEAIERVLKRVINNRELRSLESQDVSMHKMNSYGQY